MQSLFKKAHLPPLVTAVLENPSDKIPLSMSQRRGGGVTIRRTTSCSTAMTVRLLVLRLMDFAEA
jgi:hypothetical protein